MIGVDFLGFIDISSLVMAFVRKSKFLLLYCLIGFIAISLLRYFIDLYIHALESPQQASGLLNWISGVKDNSDASSPLSPGLTYPFAGYITGIAAMHYRSMIENPRFKVILSLFIFGLLIAIAALFLAKHGAYFSRWGTVGLGFYVATFAIILIGITSSLTIGAYYKSHFQEALSLRGVTYLAVVIIHSLIISLVVTVGENNVNLLRHFMMALGIINISFFISSFVENVNSKIRQSNNTKAVWFELTGLFLGAVTTTLIYSKGATSLAILSRTFGQVVLCILLGVPLPL